MKHALPLLALLLATACGGSRPAPDVYTLRVHPPEVASCRVKSSIKIYEPAAGAGLDTARITVLDSGNRLTFYQGVRWSAPATRMLQHYLSDSFDRSDMFSLVTTDDATSRTAWLLETQLRAFHIDRTGPSPRVVIRLNATLVSAAGRTPVASIPLSAERDVGGMNLSQIVSVFEQEMAGLTTDALQQLRRPLGCR